MELLHLLLYILVELQQTWATQLTGLEECVLVQYLAMQMVYLSPCSQGHCDLKCVLFFVIRKYHGLKERQNFRSSDWGAMSLDIGFSCIQFVRI